MTPRRAWAAATVLAFAHFVSFLDRAVFALVMEPVKAEFALSDTALGVLQGTGFAILYGLGAIPFGWIADRKSRRGLILGGILVWAMATVACGLARSFSELLAARVLLGLGEAALVPAALSILAGAFPPQQLGRALAVFTTGATLGKAAALAGGGLVLALLTAHQVAEPWRWLFVLMAAPALLAAALVLTLPGTPSRETATGGALAFMAQHRAAFAMQIGSASAVLLVAQGFAAWLPSFTMRSFGLDALRAGALIGGIALLAAPIGGILGGFVTDGLHKRGTPAAASLAVAIGMSGALVALIGFGLASTLTGASLAMGATIFCAAFAAPPALTGLQRITPPALRGGANAVFLAATTLIGIGAGPALIGLAADRISIARALPLMCSLFAVAAITIALGGRRAIARAEG